MIMIKKDVAVIGLGAMGAMTLWRAAERTDSVIGIEQFGIAHDRGSSHGGSRIFRRMVFEGVPYGPVVERSGALWRELERQTGVRLLTTTGGINIGTAGGELITDALTVARATSLDVEILDADQLRQRFRQHNVFEDDQGVYEPGAGVLHPENAVRAALDRAVAAGAEILLDTAVLEVRVDGDEVAVITEGQTIIAKRVVVSTGSWFTDLLPELSLPLRNQRSLLHWFGPRHGNFGPERFPVFIRESRHLNGWGIPDLDGRGVKIGISGYPKPWLSRPEDNWSPGTEDDALPVERFTREAFPGLDPGVRSSSPCMNSKTPDSDFIVGESERAPGLILLGGFSGHGFKHAAGIGDIAAQLALDGATDIDISAFSPERFGPDPWSQPLEPIFEPIS